MHINKIYCVFCFLESSAVLGKHCLFIKFYLLQSIHWANQEALEIRRRFSQVLLSELANPPHRSDAGFLSKPGKMQTQWNPAEPGCSLLPQHIPSLTMGCRSYPCHRCWGQENASPDGVPMLYVSGGFSAEALWLPQK